MSRQADEEALWSMMIEGSEELAEELDLDPGVFGTAALQGIDRFVADHDGALSEDEVARVGFLLARVLVEAHGGGLMRIAQKGHPLNGEWAVTGFRKGLAEDYVVPVFVSAARIGVDRSLGAAEWYEQLRREGR